MKILASKTQWIVASVLVAVVVLAVYMFANRGPGSAKSVEPPIEKDRFSATVVRDMDLSRKAVQMQGQVQTASTVRGTAKALLPVIVIPKVIKPIAAPVTTSVKTPTAQPSPAQKSYKIY